MASTNFSSAAFFTEKTRRHQDTKKYEGDKKLKARNLRTKYRV